MQVVSASRPAERRPLPGTEREGTQFRQGRIQRSMVGGVRDAEAAWEGRQKARLPWSAGGRGNLARAGAAGGA